MNTTEVYNNSYLESSSRTPLHGSFIPGLS